MNDRYEQTAVPARDEMATDTEIRPTICSICNPGSHCGVDAYVSNGRIIKVKGSMETHNAGTLCAKGAAGLQYVYHPDRLTTPLSEPEIEGKAGSNLRPGKMPSVLLPTGLMK